MSKTESVDLLRDVQATLDRVAGLPPAEKAKAAHEMWKQLLHIQGLVAKLRTSGVRELHCEMPLRQIAALLDVSVTRVRQIEDLADARGPHGK